MDDRPSEWHAQIAKMVRRQNEALMLLADVVDELNGGAYSGLGDAYTILVDIEKEFQP